MLCAQGYWAAHVSTSVAPVASELLKQLQKRRSLFWCEEPVFVGNFVPAGDFGSGFFRTVNVVEGSLFPTSAQAILYPLM